jgi:hypothetical protein
VLQATTGAQLSDQTGITTHRLSAENVAQVAQAGRGRWKIAHDKNHVRQTKGDHLAHHCGPGKPSLAATMRRRQVLACLGHTVLAWSDASDAFLRQVLVRRQTFFEARRALTRSRVFDSWHHLMDGMLQGLKLASRLASKLGPKLNTS